MLQGKEKESFDRMLEQNKKQSDQIITKEVTDETTDESELVSQEEAEPEPEVEITMLEAVGSYTGSGTASRYFDSGRFIHIVEAEIPEPADGKFYEGWLVKGASFFSTGKMESVDGRYELIYEANEDKSDYDDVVITEETEADGLDGKPEAHVLEGKFE